MGATLAGAGDRALAALSAYGDPLGEAFQLRDDVLGAFGDPDVTGKPVGEDLHEGKPTPLLAVACERASAADAALLDRVGDPGLTDGDVARIQHVLVATGALDEVERLVDALASRAVEAIAEAQRKTSPALTTSRISRSLKPQEVCSRLRRATGGSGRVPRKASTSSAVGATGTRSGSGK